MIKQNYVLKITVTVAGLNGTDPVKCSRDVVVVPDVALSAIDKDSFDVIVLPGGLGGAKALAESSLVGDLLKNQEKNGKLIAGRRKIKLLLRHADFFYLPAICASPALVFKAHGIGANKRITCYPSFKDEVAGSNTFVDEVVVQDGKLITSQGPSTVFAFALKIAENLVGEEKTKSVSNGLLLK